MENYKGFYIKQIPVDKKVETLAGVISGITEWQTFLVNPQTAQQMRTRDVAHAKEIVDTWFSGDGIERLNQLEKEIDYTEKHLQDLKKETEIKIFRLNKDLEDGEAVLAKLKAQLPPRWL